MAHGAPSRAQTFLAFLPSDPGYCPRCFRAHRGCSLSFPCAFAPVGHYLGDSKTCDLGTVYFGMFEQTLISIKLLRAGDGKIVAGFLKYAVVPKTKQPNVAFVGIRKALRCEMAARQELARAIAGILCLAICRVAVDLELRHPEAAEEEISPGFFRDRTADALFFRCALCVSDLSSRPRQNRDGFLRRPLRPVHRAPEGRR